MPCAYPYFLFMKKKSKGKYRIRKNELRKIGYEFLRVVFLDFGKLSSFLYA